MEVSKDHALGAFVVIALVVFAIMLGIIIIGIFAPPPESRDIAPGDIVSKHAVHSKITSYYMDDVYGQCWRIDHNLYQHLLVPER